MSNLDRNSLENRDRANVLFPTATATMTVLDQVVRGSTTGAAFTLTLPFVSEAIGKTFTIVLVSGAANRMTLSVPGNDAENTSTIEALDMNANGDRIVIYSDGFSWCLIENAIT